MKDNLPPAPFSINAMPSSGDYHATLAERNRLMKEAEDARREKPSMDTSPVNGLVDYGEAGSMMDNGIAHWDESIPNGQKRRTELAAVLVARGVLETLTWLKAKGYDVPVLHYAAPLPSLDDQAVDRFAADLKARLAVKAAEGKHGWEDGESLDAVISGYLRHSRGGNLLDAGAYLAMLRWHGLASTPTMPEFPIVHGKGLLAQGDDADPTAPQKDGFVVLMDGGSSVTVDTYDNAPDLFSETAREGDSPTVKQGMAILDEGHKAAQAEQPSEPVLPRNSWPFAPVGAEPTEKPSDHKEEHPRGGVETWPSAGVFPEDPMGRPEPLEGGQAHGIKTRAAPSGYLWTNQDPAGNQSDR